MVYCAIPAGGIGARMGATDLPKQFMDLNGQPILVRTIKALASCKRINAFYIGMNTDWLDYTKQLIAEHFDSTEDIHIVEGGCDRNETLEKIMQEIYQAHAVKQNDIIVTHDAVRPFVASSIVGESIEVAEKFGACTAAISAVDTIGVVSASQKTIEHIPERKTLYQIQTPQTFQFHILWETMQKLTVAEKKLLTDACKACLLKGQQVKIIDGSQDNFKITTARDLHLARLRILEKEGSI